MKNTKNVRSSKRPSRKVYGFARSEDTSQLCDRIDGAVELIRKTFPNHPTDRSKFMRMAAEELVKLVEANPHRYMNKVATSNGDPAVELLAERKASSRDR